MYFMIFLFMCIMVYISTFYAIHFHNKLNSASNYKALYNQALGNIEMLEKRISQLNKNWHNLSYRDKYLLEIQKHKKATEHCRKLALENKELNRKISHDQISIEILDSKNQELIDKLEYNKNQLEMLIERHNNSVTVTHGILKAAAYQLRHSRYLRDLHFNKWKRAELQCKGANEHIRMLSRINAHKIKTLISMYENSAKSICCSEYEGLHEFD